MQLSHDELSEMVGQASTIAERLALGFRSDHGGAGDELAEARLERWRRVLGADDPGRLEQRLAWDGLDLATVHPVLGRVRPPEALPLPRWAETLERALGAALPPGAAPDPNTTAPFAELCLPFVRVAAARLESWALPGFDVLSEGARATLERNLLHSLGHLCAPALAEAFLVFRAERAPGSIRRLGQLAGGQSRALYTEFVTSMLGGGLREFFREYAVLARLAATMTDQWADHVAEFVSRLAEDWPQIQATFPGVGHGCVMAVFPSLSDRHHGGRSVLALQWQSGVKLVYKPKPCATEQGWSRLLAWLNERGAPLPFRCLRVLDRGSHGWVEYVHPEPCANQEVAQRYYGRAGMLLAVLYALDATDCHFENLVACGDQPVLIDAETLFAHRVRDFTPATEGEEARRLAGEQFTYSVLRTHLLPRWHFGPGGQVYDPSGLGGTGGQKVLRKGRWRHANTDGMTWDTNTFEEVLEAKPNVPTLDGSPLSVADYADELLQGFRQMYLFLQNHATDLTAPDGPVAGMASVKVRFIFRDTGTYNALLRDSVRPPVLRDAVERDLEMDVLCKSFLRQENRPVSWPLLAAERQALTHLDVPLFLVPASAAGLELETGAAAPGLFTGPSSDLVVSRIRNLGAPDLEQQMNFIRSSLYARSDREVRLPAEPAPEQGADEVLPLSDAASVRLAAALGEDLRRRALHAADGSVTWMGLDYLPEANRFQVSPLSHDLYDGSTGVALFLAALETVAPGQGFGELARSTLRSLRALLRGLQPRRADHVVRLLGIGGGKGLGSILYGLTRTATFLEDPSLLDDGRAVLAVLTREAIDADARLDILSGSAGALLGLLALYRATNDPATLERAVWCGEHLLQARQASANGPRAWPTIRGKLLTGFSHGAAGIAYALLRLCEVCGDRGFRDAAAEGMAYERSVFSAAAGNWPDYREERPLFLANWCHGAPGIGLARLGGLDVLDDEEVRREIEVAVATTRAHLTSEIDDLCCGNFGRIETLLLAGRKLSRPDLLQAAERQAAALAARAEAAGAFQILPPAFRNVYSPSLFKGVAGVGYSLLRLTRPSLPSVMLWE